MVTSTLSIIVTMLLDFGKAGGKKSSVINLTIASLLAISEKN